MPIVLFTKDGSLFLEKVSFHLKHRLNFMNVFKQNISNVRRLLQSSSISSLSGLTAPVYMTVCVWRRLLVQGSQHAGRVRRLQPLGFPGTQQRQDTVLFRYLIFPTHHRNHTSLHTIPISHSQFPVTSIWNLVTASCPHHTGHMRSLLEQLFFSCFQIKVLAFSRKDA